LAEAEMFDPDIGVYPWLEPGMTAQRQSRAHSYDDRLGREIRRKRCCSRIAETKAQLTFRAKPAVELAHHGDVQTIGIKWGSEQIHSFELIAGRNLPF